MVCIYSVSVTVHSIWKEYQFENMYATMQSNTVYFIKPYRNPVYQCTGPRYIRLYEMVDIIIGLDVDFCTNKICIKIYINWTNKICIKLGKPHIKKVFIIVSGPLRFYPPFTNWLSGPCHFFMSYLA